MHQGRQRKERRQERLGHLHGAVQQTQEEKQKQMTRSERKAKRAFGRIFDGCKALGWSIAIIQEDDEDVDGLVIGTDEYIDKILKDD